MARTQKILAAALLSIFLIVGAALAVEPDEMLAEAALEARAQKIDKELRCVVCQSQSLAESNAPLAKDMRLLLREKIAGGASDAETVAFLVDRYGEYVLLKPRVEPATLFLWAFPLLSLAAGGAIAIAYLRAWRRPAAPPSLDSADEARLKQILEERE